MITYGGCYATGRDPLRYPLGVKSVVFNEWIRMIESNGERLSL